MSQCNILRRQMFLALASFGVAPFAVTAFAASVSAGYRETVGLSVAAGAQTALTERVALSADGHFIKAGDGMLTMPVGAVDSSVSPTVHVLGGTLALTTAATPSVDAATPPEVIARKAAFWVDAADGHGLVATNGESGAAYAARWCDRRETNSSAPTMWYAEPWWTNSTSSALWGVPPAVKTVDGRRAVFFRRQKLQPVHVVLQKRKDGEAFGCSRRLPRDWRHELSRSCAWALRRSRLAVL